MKCKFNCLIFIWDITMCMVRIQKCMCHQIIMILYKNYTLLHSARATTIVFWYLMDWPPNVHVWLINSKALVACVRLSAVASQDNRQRFYVSDANWSVWSKVFSVSCKLIQRLVHMLNLMNSPTPF